MRTFIGYTTVRLGVAIMGSKIWSEKISMAKLGGLLGATGPSAWIMCLIYVGIFTEENPSSTSGVGLVFAPIFAGGVGVIGGCIGYFIGGIVTLIPVFGKREMTRQTLRAYDDETPTLC